jgi:hypothetical protein
MPIRFILLLFSLFFSIVAISQSLESGFEALKEYDFFLAKKVFSSKLKKQPATANYGMALLRFDALNHFHSLDSAYVNVVKADSAYKILKPKQQAALQKWGVSDSSIQALQNRILIAAFVRAKNINQPAAFAYYRQFFDRSEFKTQALELEVKRAYFLADSLDTSVALQQFMATYPDAPQLEQCKKRLDDVLFREETARQNVEEYRLFIEKYPQSAHRAQAEDALYSLLTPTRSRADWYAFVKTYPTNRNASATWELIYADFTSDQRVESFEAFKQEYPEYPYPDRLKMDAHLASIPLYPAVDGELWGYVDSTGKVVLTYQYEEAWSFYDNMAMIRIDGKIGYINKAGIRVVPALYNDGEPFRQQLAIVERDGLYGLVDHRGTEVLPVEYDMVAGPDNGFYQISKDELYGYADRNGHIRIAPQYENSEPFSEGLAAVTKEGLIGFVDTLGNVVIPFQYEDVILFENGRVRVMKNDRVGLIDPMGKEIIAFKNERIGRFQEGLARVSRDGKCAYFDIDGKVIIPFQAFCSAPVLGVDGFSEGLARVEKKGKKGYINTKGKLVIPMQWEESGYFTNGRATFKKKNRWGYISTQGKTVIEAQYEEAYPFVDGKARVKKKGKYGLIGTDGSIVLACEWDELSEDGGWYIGTQNGKQVLFNPQLKQQTEVVWDEIRRSSDKEVFQLISASKMALFHVQSGTIFWTER